MPISSCGFIRVAKKHSLLDFLCCFVLLQLRKMQEVISKMQAQMQQQQAASTPPPTDAGKNGDQVKVTYSLHPLPVHRQ